LPSETFTGQAIDLLENGALRLRLPNGTIRDIHAGDVFFPANDEHKTDGINGRKE